MSRPRAPYPGLSFTCPVYNRVSHQYVGVISRAGSPVGVTSRGHQCCYSVPGAANHRHFRSQIYRSGIHLDSLPYYNETWYYYVRAALTACPLSRPRLRQGWETGGRERGGPPHTHTHNKYLHTDRLMETLNISTYWGACIILTAPHYYQCDPSHLPTVVHTQADGDSEQQHHLSRLL